MAGETTVDAKTAALGRVLELIPRFVRQWERDERTLRLPAPLGGGLLDARTLAQVVSDPGLTAGELARDLGMAGSALTAVLNRLERSGLVVRERGGRDRRVVRLVPTEEGRAVLAEAKAVRMDHLSRRLGTLSAADLDRLAGMLERMIGAWAGAPAPREEG